MHKILLVDDDRELTSLLKELLEMEGFNIVVAHDGEQALSLLDSSIDLLLLDGAKSLYSDILDLLEPHLAPGAMILADNADYCPDYLQRVRAPGSGYLSVPFADDVELSMRLR